MSEVVLHGVSVAYEGEVVVSNFDLHVASGEWIALIGPNGA
jgi:ABC-type Mn2+/Zn2+ transport system ATPase subunit